MKKIAYITPEMEIVELELNTSVLLDTSNPEGPGIGGVGPEDEGEAG